MIAKDKNHPLHPDGLRREWRRLLAEPKGLERPLVVLTGWRAPALSASLLAERLRRLTGAAEDRVLPMCFTFMQDIDKMAARVVERVEERWPGGEPGRTVEVDVVGLSMGGLVARAAALPETARQAGKRLAVANLFTLGTPHRGASAAKRIALDKSARSMRAGSAWLRRLDEGLEGAEYRMVCYARLRDWWVGARNTAPAGMDPIWFPAPLFGSHILMTQDRRIMVDIARRLRGEAPIVEPSGPPPRD